MTEITGEALGIAGFALAQAVHAWAFAREGAHRLVDSEEAADVITVDFWSKGMPYVASLVQRFNRGVGRRRVHLDGVPSIIDDGKLLDPTEGALMVDRVRQGISDHPEAERLWRYWD